MAAFVFNWNTSITMALEIITGIKARLILFCIWVSILRIIISKNLNPVVFVNAIIRIRKLKTNLISKNSLEKLVKIGKHYYWDFNQPGWPSRAFNQNIKWYCSQFINPDKKPPESVRLVFMALTKKCPMNCLHCYEGDEINKEDNLTVDILKQIVSKYQNLGAASFIIGGGEPMCRVKDLIEILRSAKPTSEFWISSSGYNLNAHNAAELKKAGLGGVSLSIDHFDTEANNSFRGHPRAMEIAIEGAGNCLSAGLGVSTALCATKDFISKRNLLKYAEFSKKLGAGFIWLIEPRAEGRYRDMNVTLEEQHFQILDDFFITLNNDKKYKDYPRVLFPNYNHRRLGCGGAGKSNIMIDTDGFVNPCPFCRKKIVHALSPDSERFVKEMIAAGCYKFKSRTA
jgi:MoaA/NifB/PqqE/SkfB family radical SAM enzyme